MLHQVISLTLIASMTAAAPSVPQGIPRNSSISGTAKVITLTPVFVGNPYINYTSLTDSAASVAIGAGMRDRMDGKIGADLAVISRQVMNTDLVTFGYSPNAILTVGSATALGKGRGARIFVTSTMAKGSNGLYTVVAHVWGVNEDAGMVVRNTQAAGQALPDFGSKTADLIIPVIKDAHPLAKNCMDLAESKPDKAIEAANKALKAVPNYGFAEYCLATIAIKKDSVGAEAAMHLANATKSDPQSLRAWSQLAVIHQIRNDSTAAVADYQAMLREDPTNNELAKSAVQVFRNYHRQDALRALVAEQKQLDPTNPDWYDLEANGCIIDNDYTCALKEMEQIWVIDSSRADTLYFQKIISIAQTKPDTQAYLKWARIGAKKFDTNIFLISSLGRGYAWAGKPDSAAMQATRIMALDASQADQALLVINDLVQAKQLAAAAKFADAASKYGDESVKNQFGGLLANPGLELQKATPPDTATMTVVGTAMLASGATNPQVVAVGHYLIAAPLVPFLQPMSVDVRAAKSCQKVKDYETFLNNLKPHLDAMAAGPIATISDYGKQLQGLVKGEIDLIPQLTAAFCKQ